MRYLLDVEGLKLRGKLSGVSREEFIQMYHIDELSSIDIAKKLNCAKCSVLRKMEKLNIPRRTVGEALSEREMPQEVKKKISKTMKMIQQGERHSSWKGGRIVNSSGYMLVWKKDHPFAGNKGYVFEHRLVAEKILGRYLTHEEVIHHIDNNPLNNSPKNLMLCRNNGEHRSVHGGKIKVAPISSNL